MPMSSLSRKILHLVMGLITLVGCSHQESNSFSSTHPTIPFSSTWQYRWGDSPKLPDSSFEWQHAKTTSDDWQSTELPTNPPGRNSDNIVWMRVKIPEHTLPNPSIWFTGVDQNMEVFLDGKLLYKFGTINDAGVGTFLGYPWHIVDLPQNSSQKTLVFRIWSGHSNAGLFGEILLGTRSTFTEKVFLNSLNSFAVGTVLLFMGIVSLVIFLVRTSGKEYFYFFLQTIFGLYIISRTMMKFSILPYPMFWICTEFIALTLGASGILGFAEFMFGPTKWHHCARLARFGLAIAAFVFLAATTNIVPIMSTLIVIQVYCLFSITFSLFATINAFRNKIPGVWMLGVGMLCLAIAGFSELGVEMRWFFPTLAGRTMLFPWGELLFVTSMGGLLMMRYDAVNKKIARLKGQLDKILRGTKEMATMYDKSSVSSKAVDYIATEFSLNAQTSVNMLLLDNNKTPSEIKNIKVFENGTLLKEPRTEKTTPEETRNIDEVLKEKKPIVTQNTVSIPVSWGEKNLGLMRIHGMGSSQFQEEESHFAQTLASSLATALANIEFVAKTEEKARMDKELETARAVQEALLPPSANFPGLDFASSYFSAAQTGGDWLGYYYDKQSHRLDFYVGDVTGHGIGPSLLTGVICGGIYSCEETLSLTASTQQQSFSLEARLSILAQVLNRIVAQTGKSHHLATMAFLSLDLSTGKGAFLNAGHNNPFIISNSTGEAHSIPNAGSRLGYTSKPQFSVRSFEVSENDIVFVYTDGLIENSGPTGKLLKPKRLKEILTTSKDVSVIQETLTTECRNLWETNLQDDVTTLFIKWKGPIDRTAITAENISIPGCSALEWNPTNS